MASKERITIALAGNPNCGKTTLFNSLTGATAHVGNWPGVTVDKKEGTYKKLSEPLHIIDLPGIYSLSPYTPEEVVSRNYILDEKPNCVINVVDATNLERNLYLTTQLLEIDIPVVVALNMADIVRKNGDKLDAKGLQEKLGVPVVEVSALRSEGLKELMEAAYDACHHYRKGTTILEDKELAHLINDVAIAFRGKGVESPLFHAIKLVELDEIETKMHPDLIPMVDEYKESHKDDIFADDFEALVADARYQYIAKHYASHYQKNEKSEKNSDGKQVTRSDKIDKVLTHRIWALPIFVLIMFLVFHLTFSEDLFFLNRWFHVEFTHEGFINFCTGMGYEGEPMAGLPSPGVFLQNWFGWATGSLIDVVSNAFENAGVRETWYASLLCDGLLTGLDAVLSFVPQVMVLFLFIAILEDSGYMSRVAFILDRAFRKFGLSGRAFIPMLSGFGCSVPAIMATRTLEDKRERNRVIRLMTCFSCGAKAPIWALIAGIGALAGFAGDIFVFSIYLGGIAAAIIFALFMKLFSKDQYVSPFVMELPAYHAPQARNVGAYLWEKFKHYMIKAATIIAAATIVIWFLSNFNWNLTLGLVDIEQSILADLGRVFAYFYYPLGWAQGADGWKYTVSTITGLIAKEQVVDTMAVLGLNEETVLLTGAQAYSFAVYNLFTIPCFAAIGAAFGEQKGKEFWLTMLWWFVMSYAVAALVFGVGALYGVAIWAGILLTLAIIGLVVAAGIIVTRRNKKVVQQAA
ncbi:MAG: ferrous iron transporter B [Erysipelotrichaceae bacterium]|nr:ferrous iron transporter B [Erysipelotrichaceae bacterium]